MDKVCSLDSVKPITQNYNNLAADVPKCDGISLRIQDPEMMQTVVDALNLLAKEVPQHYDFVKYYIQEIRESEKSGMHVDTGVFDLSKVSTTNPEWTASIIYHDAIHRYQYMTNAPYFGAEAERQANEMQVDLLKAIDSTMNQTQVQYLKSVMEKGDHSDLNGDGVYNEVDYGLRTW